jgi:hypothetical protein
MPCRPVTVEITGRNLWRRINEVEAFVGSRRLYLKGTDSSRYLDCQERAEADLLVVNLNLMPDVKARILGE